MKVDKREPEPARSVGDVAGSGHAAGILVRTARPSEYQTVGELTVAAYLGDNLFGADVAGAPAGDYEAELRDVRRRSGQAQIMVAVDQVDGALLGSVTFVAPGSSYAELAHEDEAEFRMLAVRPLARGHGVGTALVNECVARARRLRCAGVVIWAQWNMRPAHRLYQRLGFQRAPERDWYPTADVELICYVKRF